MSFCESEIIVLHKICVLSAIVFNICCCWSCFFSSSTFQVFFVSLCVCVCVGRLNGGNCVFHSLVRLLIDERSLRSQYLLLVFIHLSYVCTNSSVSLVIFFVFFLFSLSQKYFKINSNTKEKKFIRNINRQTN